MVVEVVSLTLETRDLDISDHVTSFLILTFKAAMITFTPLSGAARSSQTTPLAYILQIDDVRILIDCGSPDWVPESSPFQQRPPENPDDMPAWTDYCEALRKFVLYS